MTLILASGSPRRSELLAAAGFEFQVIPSPAEETATIELGMEGMCEGNASLKSAPISVDHPEALVIGADTLVFLDGEPLGKPKSEDQARETLRRLSGRKNQVCTGVSIRCGDHEETFSVVSDVEFKELSDETIDLYMSKVNVMDKAGSYAVQSEREMIIAAVHGAQNNIMGLPITKLTEVLSNWGVFPVKP